MIKPIKPEHANKRQDVGNGYVLERYLVGYHNARDAHETATPWYRWNLYLNGRLVDSDSRRTPLRQAARRDEYR